MAKNKTVETKASVDDFIAAIKDETKRKDCSEIIKIIKKQTGMKPKMWGSSIIGFGSYHYTYESGREGDAPLIAFSPRASAIVLYLSSNFQNREQLLAQFGKHTTGKGCVYIKKLADINIEIMKTMITNTVKHMQELYPG